MESISSVLVLEIRINLALKIKPQNNGRLLYFQWTIYSPTVVGQGSEESFELGVNFLCLPFAFAMSMKANYNPLLFFSFFLLT